MIARKLSSKAVRATRRGFTLIEMLAVVAIIVILAGVGGYYLLGQVETSKEKIAKAQVRGPLTDAVNTYKLNTGNYPASLAALTVPTEDGGPPILEHDAIVSPFGNEYMYDPAGTNNGGIKPDIWAVAPNGHIIGNWSK